MIITILGFDDKSYTKRETGEYIEGLELYYSKENRSETAVGSSCGSEYVSAKAFPEQFKQLTTLKDKVCGKKASLSKDVRIFGGKPQAVLDEFVIID